jgi:energy-coupling factor transporter ATP-binding protein EcfA2
MVNITQEILGYINNNVDVVYYALCFALGVFIVYLAKLKRDSIERIFMPVISFYYGSVSNSNNKFLAIMFFVIILLPLLIILILGYLLFFQILYLFLVLLIIVGYLWVLSDDNKLTNNKIAQFGICTIIAFTLFYFAGLVLITLLKIFHLDLNTELLRYGYLSVILGFLIGIVVWKHDLLKISKSSENEETNNHKKDKPKILKYLNDDYFGVWEKIKAIDEVLTKTDVLLNHKIIALYGDWGCGKSTVIETLKYRIEKEEKIIKRRTKNGIKDEKLISIKFDAWKYEKEDNLPYALLEFILSELENHGKVDLKTKAEISIIKNKLLKSGKIVFKSIHVSYSFLRLTFEPKNDEGKAKEIENLIEDFKMLSDILKDSNKRLIVFIDELDRCEIENVLNLLSSIKLLFASGENINYFVAVDKKAVSKALENRYGDKIKAEEYLEKIFNFSFYMPEFSVEKFIMQYDFFREYEKKHKGTVEKIAKFFEAIDFTNPRHLKKVLNKYEYLVNVKTSNNVSRDLKNLIPKIITGNNDNDEYLLDTIFVLYFIILYEFHQDILKEMKLSYYSKINAVKNPDWILSFSQNKEDNYQSLKKLILKVWVLEKIAKSVGVFTKENIYNNIPISGLIGIYYEWRKDKHVGFEKEHFDTIKYFSRIHLNINLNNKKTEEPNYSETLYNFHMKIRESHLKIIEDTLEGNCSPFEYLEKSKSIFNSIIDKDKNGRIFNPISVLSYFFMPNLNENKPTAKYSSEHNEYLTATLVRSDEYNETSKIYANFWIYLERLLEEEYKNNSNYEKLGSKYNILNLFEMVETLL